MVYPFIIFFGFILVHVVSVKIQYIFWNYSHGCVILFTAINSVLHVPRNWSIALTYVQGTCYIILASQPGEQW